jgi:hypothetical protein
LSREFVNFVACGFSALAQGSLINAAPGQFPVLLTSNGITISAQRYFSDSYQNAQIGSAGVSTTSSGGGYSTSTSVAVNTFLFPTTILADVFGNASLAPASLDISMITYTNNIFTFVDNFTAGGSTLSPIISLSMFSTLPSGKSGAELVISNLSQPIVIKLAHPSIAAATLASSGFIPSCRFWNSSGNAWSTYGCTTMPGSSSTETWCACNHLTAFNIERVFVPPIQAITPQMMYAFVLLIIRFYSSMKKSY